MSDHAQSGDLDDYRRTPANIADKAPISIEELAKKLGRPVPYLRKILTPSGNPPKNPSRFMVVTHVPCAPGVYTLAELENMGSLGWYIWARESCPGEFKKFGEVGAETYIIHVLVD